MSNFTVRGIVGSAPVVRKGEYGSFVAFTVADNQSRREDDGSWTQTATTWYSVVVSNQRLAQLVMDHVSKGQLVEVEASFIRASVYTAQDGTVRPSLRMTARSVSIPLSRQMANVDAGKLADDVPAPF